MGLMELVPDIRLSCEKVFKEKLCPISRVDSRSFWRNG